MQNKSKPKYITTRKLQRITYASWAWLAVSLLLLGQVLFEYMIPSGQYALLDQLSSSIIFPFYATVILLIISIVADLFYSRRVIINKEKEANKTLTKYTRIYIIMISAAFITFWAIFIETFWRPWPPLSSSQAGFETSIIVVFFYLLALLTRVIFVKKFKYIRIISWLLMISIVVAMLVASFNGPITVRKDNQKQWALNTIEPEIRRYVYDHNRLPDSLDSLEFKESSVVDANAAKSAIKNNLVSYSKLDSKIINNNSLESHEYQLCTTYNKDAFRKLPSNFVKPSKDTIKSIYSAGYHCYDLKA